MSGPAVLLRLPAPGAGARRALAATREADALRIATAAIDTRATSPAGPVWLPLFGHTDGQAPLIDLDLALPDPWRGYRDRRAHERREAAERERALLRADEDDGLDLSGIPAGEEEFGCWVVTAAIGMVSAPLLGNPLGSGPGVFRSVQPD